MLTMGRQIGSALGVAVLVAVLGGSAVGVAAFHDGWLITTVGALATGLALSALGPVAQAADVRTASAVTATSAAGG